MQRCRYCGHENEDVRESCSECGTELHADRVEPARFLPKMGRSVVVRLLVLAALALLAVFQYKHGPERIDTLEISGTPRFKEQVANSLMLLKTRSPQSYRIVTNYIGRIVQAKRSGMVAYANPPTLQLNERTAFYSLSWCASSIAHDSIHSKLYNDYRKLYPTGAYAPDTVWTGAEAERQCCEHQTRVLKEIGAPVHELTWSAETNNRYWEIDYEKRNW